MNVKCVSVCEHSRKWPIQQQLIQMITFLLICKTKIMRNMNLECVDRWCVYICMTRCCWAKPKFVKRKKTRFWNNFMSVELFLLISITIHFTEAIHIWFHTRKHINTHAHTQKWIHAQHKHLIEFFDSTLCADGVFLFILNVWVTFNCYYYCWLIDNIDDCR